MGSRPLTKRQIDSATYSGQNSSRDVRWDSTIPGLGIRVYPNGRKAFVLSYRCHGRKRLMTLGTYGVVTLEQARARAREALGQIANNLDPLEKRRLAISGETMADLCAAYLERHAKVHKRSWKDDQSRIDNFILPAWGTRHATSITKTDVEALHRKVGKKHLYAANRLLVLLSMMFELARAWQVIEQSAINPARGIVSFREEKRDRWITPQELPALARAIDEETNVVARQAIWLYLLTSLRKSELLGLQWKNVDWDRREVRVGETKSGRPHYSPLTTPALQILRNLPRLDGNPYVLPGRVPGKHLVNVDKPWRRIRKVAKIEDVRLHDLRRTMGSWLAQSGNSLHLIGRVLNHSTPNTTHVYARFANDHVRSALESYGETLLSAARRQSDTSAHAIEDTEDRVTNSPAEKSVVSGVR